MTPEQFCYWLQGFFELNGTVETKPPCVIAITNEQAKMIQDHLQTVFKKVTPTYTTTQTVDYFADYFRETKLC